MCIQPKRIINRSLHFDETKPLYLVVPCGHCYECQSRKRSDWFVRSFYEWQSNVQTYFYTLTYNNSNLPHIQGKPCFCKRHVQLFLKRFRKRLSALGITLRYLLTCEYGTRRGRPHYHALFFVDKHINQYLFYQYVKDSWMYGFVQQGKFAGLVKSDSALSYVTKYITKDVAFMDEDSVKGIIMKIRHSIFELYRYYKQRYLWKLNYDEQDVHLSITSLACRGYDPSRRVLSDNQKEFVLPFIRRFSRLLGDFLPFHLQSQRYGYCFLETDMKNVDFNRDEIKMQLSNGNVSKFALPSYYRRKLWYDVIEGENTHKMDTFVLNEEGIRHSLAKLEYKVKHAKESYIGYFDENFLSSLPFDVLSYLDAAKLNHVFGSLGDLVNYMHYAQLSLDMKLLQVYASVFRGRMCMQFSEFYNCPADYFLDSWRDVAEFQLREIGDVDFGVLDKSNPLLSSLDEMDIGLFDRIDCFLPYEFFLRVVESIDVCLRILNAKAKADEELSIRRVRELNNNF